MSFRAASNGTQSFCNKICGIFIPPYDRMIPLCFGLFPNTTKTLVEKKKRKIILMKVESTTRTDRKGAKRKEREKKERRKRKKRRTKRERKERENLNAILVAFGCYIQKKHESRSLIL